MKDSRVVFPLRPGKVLGELSIVSLYVFPIEDDKDCYRMAYSLLPPTEQVRYQRIASQQVQRTHVISRAVLRLLGSRASQTSAREWPIVELPGGKPYCPLPGAPQFNLSHARHGDDAYGLLALATTAVGVDLEIARSIGDLSGMGAIVLSESEQVSLRAVPAVEQSDLFLRLWTLKEATLKAMGTGFRNDPRAIDFGELALTPLKNAGVSTFDGCQWYCSEIFLAKQLVAALCSAIPAQPTVKQISTRQLKSWIATCQ